MRIGAIFPQTEIGSDPVAIRDYAQTVEGLGFTHLLAYDHVLGANPERPRGYTLRYTHQHPFHEVFVLLGFIAGVTQKLELVTGILILPQRQTALAAKQAATLDTLSGGRLRLGVGLGWNAAEYIALDENFHNRGKRIEEQIEVMRRLWVEPLVDYHGEWHTIPDAGINPLPVQRPIPIWFGGHAEPVLRRLARLGDGWLPLHPSAAEAISNLALLDRFLEEAGRTRADIGIEARVKFGDGIPSVWEQIQHGWQAEGASHLTIDTMNCGFTAPDEHIQALQKFARVMVQGA
jgi:probable F420-dependent oxidoreductase